MKNLTSTEKFEAAKRIVETNKFYLTWSDKGNSHSSYYPTLDKAKSDYYWANYNEICEDRESEVDIRTLPNNLDLGDWYNQAEECDNEDEIEKQFHDWFWSNSVSVAYKTESWKDGHLNVIEGLAPYATSTKGLFEK